MPPDYLPLLFVFVFAFVANSCNAFTSKKPRKDWTRYERAWHLLA